MILFAVVFRDWLLDGLPDEVEAAVRLGAKVELEATDFGEGLVLIRATVDGVSHRVGRMKDKRPEPLERAALENGWKLGARRDRPRNRGDW